MKILLPAACVMAIALSCNSSNRSGFLSTNNLSGTHFEINSDKDTVLFSTNGASISIKAGSLRASANPIQLELKEAYSIRDIVTGGLITISNGQPISSGGMIYLSPTGRQSVEILTPIVIRIPTPRISQDMILYEGEMKDDELINWKTATSGVQNLIPVTPSPAAKMRLQYGQQLFNTKCASCHSLQADNIQMQDIADRMKNIDPDHPKLLYAWTRDPQAVLASGNGYYNQLFEKWNRTLMPAFPELTDRDLAALYNYLDHAYTEAANQSAHSNPCLDSCLKYYENTIKTNGNDIDVNHYQFSIAGFGWHNVAPQQYISSVTSIQEHTPRLNVTVPQANNHPLEIYLIIPSAHMFLPGSRYKGHGNSFYFQEPKQALTVPLGAKAFFIAMMESGDQLLFEMKALTIEGQQFEKLDLKPYTRAEIDSVFLRLDENEFKVLLQKARRAKEVSVLKQVNHSIDSIKFSNCHCEDFFK